MRQPIETFICFHFQFPVVENERRKLIKNISNTPNHHIKSKDVNMKYKDDVVGLVISTN